VLRTDSPLRVGEGATASRPSASAVGAGTQWYDTSLGQPIWSNGTVWRDAAWVTVCPGSASSRRLPACSC
jgi:hypothetical protein